MSQTSGFEPTSEDSIGESATSSFSATGLTNNTEYHFQVAAVDSSGYRGSFSQELSAIPKYKGPVWWVDVINGQDKCDGSRANIFNGVHPADFIFIFGYFINNKVCWVKLMRTQNRRKDNYEQ